MSNKTDVSLNASGEVTLYVGGKKIWRGAASELSAQLGLVVAALPPKKAARPKEKSRAARWAEACAAASSALDDLVDLKSEYEDWQSNLPENLADSLVGEKLQAVADLDLDSAKSIVEEAEGLDLPMGFGRD